MTTTNTAAPASPPTDEKLKDYGELRRLAEAATPGPWIECGPSFGKGSAEYFNEVVVDRPDTEEDSQHICQTMSGITHEGSADMAFIAAFNPATALELLTELDTLRQQAGRKG